MKYLRWILVFLLIIGLVLVRKFETQLFYDPLLEFFHTDFTNSHKFPVIDISKHFVSIFFRYLINSILSIIILYLIFLDKKVVKFTALIMGVFFVIFWLPYHYFINIDFNGFYTVGFYVRRMLIQPVLLLILIPAIWFYQQQKHKI